MKITAKDIFEKLALAGWLFSVHTKEADSEAYMAFAEEYHQSKLKNHGDIGDDIKEVYEIGRKHEANGSDCTSQMIKDAWVRADDLCKNLKFE